MQLIDPQILAECGAVGGGVRPGHGGGGGLVADGLDLPSLLGGDGGDHIGGLDGSVFQSGLSRAAVGGRLVAGGGGGSAVLAPSRVVAFAAGGVTLWLVIHSIAPQSWHEPFVCLIGGGLAGLLLFRIWLKILTSFVAP